MISFSFLFSIIFPNFHFLIEIWSKETRYCFLSISWNFLITQHQKLRNSPVNCKFKEIGSGGCWQNGNFLHQKSAAQIQAKFYAEYVCTINCWKDENNEKEAWNTPFKKLRSYTLVISTVGPMKSHQRVQYLASYVIIRDSVWPNLAKFSHFGEFLNSLAKTLRAYLAFGNNLMLLTLAVYFCH